MQKTVESMLTYCSSTDPCPLKITSRPNRMNKKIRVCMAHKNRICPDQTADKNKAIIKPVRIAPGDVRYL